MRAVLSKLTATFHLSLYILYSDFVSVRDGPLFVIGINWFHFLLFAIIDRIEEYA